MRIVMFYSSVESFNYFTEQITAELQKRGADVFILDLRNMRVAAGHALSDLTAFLDAAPVDAAIAYDGFGVKEPMFISLWDSLGVPCVNILMDHPLRFHDTMTQHPRRYIQFCCDRLHVDYVKKYFSDTVSEVYFLPHAGTLPEAAPDFTEESYQNRKYSILFSGTYYDPDTKFNEIHQWFPADSAMDGFYRNLAELMRSDPTFSPEQAVDLLIDRSGAPFDLATRKVILRCSEPVDWCVRLHNRGNVIRILADAGFDVWLLGRGWENHPSHGLPNFHILSDRVPFAETFAPMSQAKINLNVFPNFKAGSHDRIFNIYLQGSLPLTDGNAFLADVYGSELPLFELEHMDRLPDIVRQLLDDPASCIEKIRCGYEKTAAQFTWENLTDQVLEVL